MKSKFGIGYRNAIHDEIAKNATAFDVLEILTDQFIGIRGGLERLGRLAERYSLLPHGVGLSVASTEGPPRSYLQQIKEVCDTIASDFYSEHLCATRAGGIELGHLGPFPLTDESFEVVCRNVDRVQETLKRPLLLENITLPFEFSCDTISYPQFLSKVAEATGCGVLLDVANLYINSKNHDFDPDEYLEALPRGAVRYFHLAGGIVDHVMYVDSHSQDVPPPVWSLYKRAYNQLEPEYVIIERDSNFPEIDQLLKEVETARSVCGNSGVSIQESA